jgi:hypothetical protein
MPLGLEVESMGHPRQQLAPRAVHAEVGSQNWTATAKLMPMLVKLPEDMLAFIFIKRS